MMGSVTIRYKASMSWTDYKVGRSYKNKNILCDVIHEVRRIKDGTWITVNLDWTPCDGLLVAPEGK